MNLSAENSSSRIAFLDAARALAALLGVLLHAAAGYLKYPVAAWPSTGHQSYIYFDYLACAIHLFRVPVFFFLAGFFCEQLWRKSTALQFSINRFRRILLPFLMISLLLNFPVLIAKVALHELHTIRDVLNIFYNLGYLWFLEYLCIDYMIFLALALIIRYLPFKLSNPKRFVNRYLNFPLMICLMMGCHFLYLYKGGYWFTPILLSYMPDPILLGIYSVYFMLGFLVAYVRSDKFFTLKWSRILVGSIGYGLYIYLVQQFPHSENLRIIAIALYALASYYFFISFLSLCFTFLSQKNTLLEYLSRASYWIYLTHVFFIMLFSFYASRWVTSVGGQFVIVSTGSLLLSLMTYQLFLRKASPLHSR